MKCPNCQAENPSNLLNCQACGAELVNFYTAPTSAMVPPREFRPPSSDGGDETVSTIIPYKNPSALIAYYLSLFSCFPIPLVGLALGIVSIVLAVKGFKAVRLNPKAHGTAHAWIAVICGSMGVLIGVLSTTMAVIVIIAAITKK